MVKTGHERLEGIFGPAGIRKKEAGVKKLWHYGVDGEDGLVGHDTLRRSDDSAKATERSPAGLINDAGTAGLPSLSG